MFPWQICPQLPFVDNMKCGHTCKKSSISHSIATCNDENIRAIWEGQIFYFLQWLFLQAPHTATYHHPRVGQGTRPTTTLVTDSIPFLYLFVIVMVSLLLELGGFCCIGWSMWWAESNYVRSLQLERWKIPNFHLLLPPSPLLLLNMCKADSEPLQNN